MTPSTPDFSAVGRYVDLFNRALTLAPPAIRGRVNALDLRRGSSYRIVLATHGVSNGQAYALRCRHGEFEVGPYDGGPCERTVAVDRAHLYEVINAPWRFVSDPCSFELGMLLAECRPQAELPGGLMRRAR